ncbi:MAG TPA: OmpA family protein [Kofleriaceae bacterium]|nr:OmpA family protein [Kofleriaceae bacterium]
MSLPIKSPRVRRAARSPNPSRILLLGDPPRSLTKALARKGHHIDVADDPGDASRSSYDLVVADADKVDAARAAFPNAHIVSRPAQNKTAVARVERSLARQPTRLASRAPVRSREQRLPVRVGGTARGDERQVVGVADTRPEPVPSMTAATKPAVDPSPSDGTRAPVVAMSEKPRPTREPKHVQRARKFTSVVFFGTNRYQLSGHNRQLLRRDAEWLAQNTGTTITVAGHTDAAGAAQYNLMLSEKRANAVRDFLVSEGVSSSRIDVVSFGEERPAYDNPSKNRRVEIQK